MPLPQGLDRVAAMVVTLEAGNFVNAFWPADKIVTAFNDDGELTTIDQDEWSFQLSAVVSYLEGEPDWAVALENEWQEYQATRKEESGA